MKTNLSKLIAGLTMATAFAATTLLPADAQAQGRHLGWDKQHKDDRRRNDDRRRDDDRRRNDDRRDDDRRNDNRRDYDRRNDQRGDNRQNQKNTWRNLGYVGGAAGIAGLLTGNRTLAALGLGGGLYSAYRYEQDRKSQNRNDHSRYELFNRNSFDHAGHHYERRTRTVNGQRNYYFSRVR